MAVQSAETTAENEEEEDEMDKKAKKVTSADHKSKRKLKYVSSPLYVVLPVAAVQSVYMEMCH